MFDTAQLRACVFFSVDTNKNRAPGWRNAKMRGGRTAGAEIPTRWGNSPQSCTDRFPPGTRSTLLPPSCSHSPKKEKVRKNPIFSYLGSPKLGWQGTQDSFQSRGQNTLCFAVFWVGLAGGGAIQSRHLCRRMKTPPTHTPSGHPKLPCPPRRLHRTLTEQTRQPSGKTTTKKATFPAQVALIPVFHPDINSFSALSESGPARDTIINA